MTLISGRLGRRGEEPKALSLEQKMRIKRLITENCPDQLDMAFALWTREAVAMLIERDTGVRLASRTTIGDYLGDWHFTAQHPQQRASKRREPAVRSWLDCNYPAIVARAKAEGAAIHWGDDTGVSNQANYGRSFSSKARTPVIPRRRHALPIR